MKLLIAVNTDINILSSIDVYDSSHNNKQNTKRVNLGEVFQKNQKWPQKVNTCRMIMSTLWPANRWKVSMTFRNGSNRRPIRWALSLSTTLSKYIWPVVLNTSRMADFKRTSLRINVCHDFPITVQPLTKWSEISMWLSWIEHCQFRTNSLKS